MQFEIRQNGEILNPCKDMSEAQARSLFAMYSGPQASKGRTYSLSRDGVEIERKDAPKSGVGR